MRTVGIDLSASPAKTAVACVDWDADKAVLTDLVVGADDTAVAPEALLGRLQRRRAGVNRGADESVDRRRLCDHERQRERTKAGRQRV